MFIGVKLEILKGNRLGKQETNDLNDVAYMKIVLLAQGSLWIEHVNVELIKMLNIVFEILIR